MIQVGLMVVIHLLVNGTQKDFAQKSWVTEIARTCQRHSINNVPGPSEVVIHIAQDSASRWIVAELKILDAELRYA